MATDQQNKPLFVWKLQASSFLVYCLTGRSAQFLAFMLIITLFVTWLLAHTKTYKITTLHYILNVTLKVSNVLGDLLANGQSYKISICFLLCLTSAINTKFTLTHVNSTVKGGKGHSNPAVRVLLVPQQTEH